MTKLTMKQIIVAVLVTLATLSTLTQAAFIGDKSSSAFDYKYEMDFLPWDTANIDLDNNSARDWVQTSSSHFSLDNGILKNVSATSGGILSNDSNWSGIWPIASITEATGYSVEFKLKINEWTGGTGAYKVQMSPVDGALTDVYYITDDSFIWYVDGGEDIEISTASNMDNFHTFRIVRYGTTEGNPKCAVFRDDILIADNLETTWTSSPHRFYAGDIDSTVSSKYDLDYLRFTGGAWNVPEPATISLFALVGAAVLRRKRN